MAGRSVRSAAAAFIRERVVRRLLPDAVTNHLNRNDRAGALYRAWGHVYSNHLRGAYYEFGVYRGERFRESHRMSRRFAAWLQGQLRVTDEPWRRTIAAHYAEWVHHFYAFDTFEGMPENGEGNVIFSAGHFHCALDEFRRLNRKASLLEGPTVRIFPGTFAAVARRDAEQLAQLQPAAIVNLDCDLYTSTVEALDLVAPKLQQGCVLLVDDWNGFATDPKQGQRRAVAEFLAEHPAWQFEPWFAYEYSGQAFLVHAAGHDAA